MKTPLIVACVGDRGVGKTTLASAVTHHLASRRLSRALNVEDIHASPDEKLRGSTMNIAALPYTTGLREVVHLDLPGHDRYFKNVLAGLSVADVALVVVDGTVGVSSQTRTLIRVARQWKTPWVAGYVTCTDRAEPDLVELARLELADALAKSGYPDATVGSGSPRGALRGDEAGLEGLVSALDATPGRTWPAAPSRFLVIRVNPVPGRGTFVWGRALGGGAGAGDRLEIIGGAPPRTLSVAAVERFGRVQRRVDPGGWSELLLRDTPPEAVARGSLLCTPGLAEASTGMRGTYDSWTRGERAALVRLHVHAGDTNATLDSTGRLALAAPLWIEPGMPYLARVDGSVVGVGEATAIDLAVPRE